jgi:hypothetical protein
MTAPSLLARVLVEQARSSVNPLRACEVCDHGTGADHQCMHSGRPVRASVARSDAGHCGPDARHQRIKGDDLDARPGLQLHLAWQHTDD